MIDIQKKNWSRNLWTIQPCGSHHKEGKLAMNTEALNVRLCEPNIGIVQEVGVLLSNSFLFISARAFQVPNIILPQKSS